MIMTAGSPAADFDAAGIAASINMGSRFSASRKRLRLDPAGLDFAGASVNVVVVVVVSRCEPHGHNRDKCALAWPAQV